MPKRKRKQTDNGFQENAEHAAAAAVDGSQENVKYKGVWKDGKRYRAAISTDSKRQYLGFFDTAKEAAQAFDRAAIEAGRPISKLNFLDQVPQDYKPKMKKLQSNNTIGYRGVYKNGTRFTAKIYQDGKQYHLGYFDATREAAIAYDLAAIQAKRSKSDLNFPDMIHVKKKINKKKKKQSGNGSRGGGLHGSKKKRRKVVPMMKVATKKKIKQSTTSMHSTRKMESNKLLVKKKSVFFHRGFQNGLHITREFPRIRTE